MARSRALGPLGLVALTSLACASAPRPAPTPATATPDVAVEKAAIDRSIERNLPALRACYRSLLALDQGFERRLTFYVYVTPSGHVEDPMLTDGIEEAVDGKPVSALPHLNGDVVGCLSHQLRTWALPPTAWQGEVRSAARPLVVARFRPVAECPAPMGASRDELQTIMRRSRGGTKPCYTDYAARAAHRADTVTILARILVNERGRVTDVTLREPNLLDEALDACLVGELRKIDFSGAPRRPLDFCYPFTFTGWH